MCFSSLGVETPLGEVAFVFAAKGPCCSEATIRTGVVTSFSDPVARSGNGAFAGSVLIQVIGRADPGLLP